MKYILLLKKNSKKQKGAFFGMLILVFIITMELCAVLAVGQNSRVYESEQLDRVGYGDVTSWIIEQPGVEELIDQIEELRGTEKTERQNKPHFHGLPRQWNHPYNVPEFHPASPL